MLEAKKLGKVEFTKILQTFSVYTQLTDDINKYKHGYHNKNIIYYNETSLICTESHLKYLDLLDGEHYTDWKQVIITLDTETVGKKVQADITGSIAKAIVMKQLYKKYTKDEVEDTLNSYTNEYSYDKKQYHYLTDSGFGLTVYENCVGYDINGAHNYYLSKMFPLSAKYFEKLYNERKEKPNNKKIANYFAGMLKAAGYEGAYNWIVQNTTELLLNMKHEVEGKSGITVYANTDGFITQNAAKLITGSTKLGEFKIELQGTVYVYRDKNYYAIQYTDINGKKVLKGNLLTEVRHLVDLEEGIVVHYDKVQNEFGQFEAKNIITEEI